MKQEFSSQQEKACKFARHKKIGRDEEMEHAHAMVLNGVRLLGTVNQMLPPSGRFVIPFLLKNPLAASCAGIAGLMLLSASAKRKRVAPGSSSMEIVPVEPQKRKRRRIMAPSQASNGKEQVSQAIMDGAGGEFSSGATTSVSIARIEVKKSKKRNIREKKRSSKRASKIEKVVVASQGKKLPNAEKPQEQQPSEDPVQDPPPADSEVEKSETQPKLLNEVGKSGILLKLPDQVPSGFVENAHDFILPPTA